MLGGGRAENPRSPFFSPKVFFRRIFKSESCIDSAGYTPLIINGANVRTLNTAVNTTTAYGLKLLCSDWHLRNALTNSAAVAKIAGQALMIKMCQVLQPPYLKSKQTFLCKFFVPNLRGYCFFFFRIYSVPLAPPLVAFYGLQQKI